MQSAAGIKQGWHIAKWGFWGWLETAVKAVGIGAGIVALFTALSAGGFTLDGNPRLAAVIAFGLLTLFTFFITLLRFRQREIVSIIFWCFNFLGHLGALLLLSAPAQTTLPLILAVAFVAGELVKQRFLVLAGYTENGLSTGQIVNFSRGVMVFYLIVVVLLLI